MNEYLKRPALQHVNRAYEREGIHPIDEDLFWKTIEREGKPLTLREWLHLGRADAVLARVAYALRGVIKISPLTSHASDPDPIVRACFGRATMKVLITPIERLRALLLPYGVEDLSQDEVEELREVVIDEIMMAEGDVSPPELMIAREFETSTFEGFEA